jgi:phenylacetic acid degradation operon negative regulatory protein
MAARTQDLIITLYGEYIRHRGGEAWTGSLIQLMDCLGTSEQATRSALSRLSRKRWLASRREGRRSFYCVTEKATTILEEAAQRIYHPRQDPWDGQWHIVTYSIPEELSNNRDKLRTRLKWLGFGQLSPGTWISPRNERDEVEKTLKRLDLMGHVEWFSGEHKGFTNNLHLVKRSWNLDRLNGAYADFVERFQPRLTHFQDLIEQNNSPVLSDFFVERFWLVHEYRSFPYVDPNLPPELLPDDWLGYQADEIFKTFYDLLTEMADQFVNETLQITEEAT